MAHRSMAMRDGLFWGLTGAFFAAIMAGAIGFVFARFYGAGWIGGGALGTVIFLIAALILARTAASPNLAPPNTLKAPVAPPGGAFQAPPGGAFRAPGAPVRPEEPPSAFKPAPAESFSDMSQSAGEAVGKAAYGVSAAVTSAAQAAREAISGAMEPDPSPATPAAAAPDAPPATPVATPVAPVETARPEGLDAAREGGADDLKRIKGVGPKLEEMLNGNGYYHFDQIAAWGPAEIAWVDANIEGFYGRATRDDWVGQARLLASGGETEFSQRVDKGEVY